MMADFGYIIPQPDQIPLYYFYFAWRKARRYQKAAFGFYDPVELEEFELNLEDELNSIHNEFATFSYKTKPLRFYCTPKAPKAQDFLKKETEKDKILVDVRPVAKVALRDQVAWATVVLALGEWFDTNPIIYKEAEFRNEAQKKVYRWMLKWSCNNRLRRRYYLQDNGYERRLLNLTNSDLYESYQWSLRKLRHLREEQFDNVRNSNSGIAYYGEADISCFYPSLNLTVVKKTLIDRLNTLNEAGLIADNADNNINKWNGILEGLCGFTIDDKCMDLDPDLRSLKIKSDDLEKKLPIGLISAGFLANCVLTKHLDCKLDDFCMEERKKGNPTYVTRYTDDVLIVSSKAETVFSTLDKIGSWLGKIGLKLSGEKTKPMQKSFFEEQHNNKFGELGLTADQIEGLYQIHIKCPRIGFNDSIPGTKRIVDKLSVIGDQNLSALTNKELRDFLNEIFQLIDTKFAPEEIKDDTKASFASWRLKKAAKELSERKLLKSSENEFTQIIDKLRSSFHRYPYKLLLLDSYIIFLLENYENFNKQIKQELKNLFAFLNPHDTQKTDSYASCRFLRTKMLFTIAAYWSSLQLDSRRQVKEIIYTEISNWYYTVHPCWHEQIAVYWLFTVADIKHDTHLANGKDPVVVRIFNLWKLNRQDITIEIDPALVMTMSSVLKRRRVQDLPRQPLSSSETNWIKWMWSNLEKKSYTYRTKAPRMWLELAYGREEIVPQFGFRQIISIAEQQEEDLDTHNILMHSEGKIPILNSVIDIIDRMIVFWLINSGEKFVVDFISAVGKFPEQSKIREYIMERMTNLDLIKIWVQLEIANSSMPDFISNYNWRDPDYPELLKKDSIATKNVPIKDWLDAISVCQQFEQIPKIMFPLNETEITELIRSIIRELRKKAFVPNTMNILINKQEWFKWRKQKRRDSGELTCCLPKINIETVDYWDDYYYSPWLYFRDMQLDVKSVCYSLVKLLMRLMARRKYSNEHGIMRLHGWVNMGNIIYLAASPSSMMVELIAGALNYQRPLYEYLSEQWGLSLSLLPLEALLIKELDVFGDIIEKHWEESCLNYKHGLEIKSVDIDMISRWQDE
jgi:hypothetical protein